MPITGISYQSYEDALINKFLTEKGFIPPEYQEGVQEYDMTVDMIRNTAIPTYALVLSWFTGTGGATFPDEKVKASALDPLPGYLVDKVDDITIKVDPVTFKLYVDSIPIATSVKVGGVSIGAQYFLYMQGNNLMLNVETNPALIAGDYKVPTSRAVKNYVDAALVAGGAGGDMFKSTYDTTNNGIVDDSSRLGNELPAYYLAWANFTGIPSTFTPAAHNHAWSEITSGKPTTLAGYGITDAQGHDIKLDSIAGLTYTSTSFVKMTAANTFTLDTNAYSLTSHNHTGTYEPFITKSTGYLRYTGAAWEFKNESYSLASHDHSGVYEPYLGVPGTNGHVLASTTGGSRSWVPLGGDTFKTFHTAADSGYTWATSDIVASGTDTMDIIPGSGIAIDTDATLKAFRIRVTGSGGLTSAYTAITDGTTTASASGGDTFKLRSADNKLAIVVTNDDATHGDNALFTINQGNIDHNALTNYDPNKHFLQTSITNISTALSTGLVKVTTTTGALSVITDNSTTWNAAQPGHANLTSLATLTYASLSFVKMSASGIFSLDTSTYLTSQTSHADVLVDGDFASQGLMKRGASAGVYSIVTDSSANWNTAYGWGNHASAGYAAASHAHGNITNAGAIGSTTNLPIITTTSGVLTVGSFGSAANTFCQGNDARLSDARTPTTHTLEGHSATVTIGKLLVGTGPNTFGWKAMGTASQLIRTNSGATNIEWFTPTYISGNQTITLSGDVSGSGTTAITTTIEPNKVTLAMMATIATDSFLGRDTATTGNVEVLSVATVKTMLSLGSAAYTASSAYEVSGAVATHAALQTGVHGISITAGKTLSSTNTLTLTGTDGSTLTIGAGGTLGTGAYATIANYALVGQTMYVGTTSMTINRTSAAQALTGITSIDGSAATLTTGRTIAMTGDVAWTSPSFNGSGNVTATSAIGANKVTLAMMAQVATARFLGRITAATGNVEAMTGAQATSLLDVFGAVKGLVPLSAGGATNFLRADGTWNAPVGTVPADGIFDWDGTKYAPYATKAAGVFYSEVVTPSNSNALYYDGNLYTNGLTVTTNVVVQQTVYANAIRGGYFYLYDGGGDYTSFTPLVADSGTSVAYTLDTKNSLTTTAKIASFLNNGVEKFYIRQDGVAFSNGTQIGTIGHHINTHSATAWRMFYSNATTTAIQELAFGAAGTFIRSAGSSSAPVFSTLVLPNAATQYRLVLATATNTYGETANLTFNIATSVLDVGGDISLGSGHILRGPGLELPHIIRKVASANTRNTNVAVGSTASTTYFLVKKTTITNGMIGTMRVSFEMKSSVGGSLVYGKVYVNGIAAGAEKTNGSTSYSEMASDDITGPWNPGATIEVWAHSTIGTTTCYVQNLKLKYDDGVSIVTVASVDTL